MRCSFPLLPALLCCVGQDSTCYVFEPPVYYLLNWNLHYSQSPGRRRLQVIRGIPATQLRPVLRPSDLSENLYQHTSLVVCQQSIRCRLLLMLRRTLRTPLSAAPKYRHSLRFAQQYQTRLKSLDSTQPATRAEGAFRGDSTAAPNFAKRSGTGLWTVALLITVAVGGALVVPLVKSSPKHKRIENTQSSPFAVSDLTDSYLVMAPNTPAGRPGTLTPDEEQKLREMWTMTLKVFGVESLVEGTNGSTTPAAVPANEAPADKEGKKEKEKKKSRLNVFRRNKGEKGADTDSIASGTSTPSDISSLSISAEHDKHGQTAEFKAAVANIPPEELRRAFWSMVKHDHPDALLLRFLRARKWDVEKALVMMVSTMHWRLEEQHVDDDIVKNGELAALNTKGDDAKAKKNADDFLTQLRLGKSFLHGLDNEGRPMCFVRVKLHKAGEQTEESLERFTVYTIETARLLLRSPIDTAASLPSPTLSPLP